MITKTHEGFEDPRRIGISSWILVPSSWTFTKTHEGCEDTKSHEGFEDTKTHEGFEDRRRIGVSSWILALSSWTFTKTHEGSENRRRIGISSWILVLSSWTFVFAQTPLPPGALTLINEDRYGSLIALCADTGAPVVQQGPKKIRATAVWAGRQANLRKVQAGVGACDPAWAPDGRRLAVTSAEGLWVIPANAAEGSLRVESRIPLGEPVESTYRAFSDPEWSSDGTLVALVVTNGGAFWVEVFEVATGKLLYTSPPGNDSFSWGRGRALRLGSAEIRLPATR
jgi:hypothetical protein